MASGGRVGFVWHGLTMASFGSAGRIGFVLQTPREGGLGSVNAGWCFVR